MNNYKTSKDYPHLKQLLDEGHEVVIIHPVYGVGKAYKYVSYNHKIVKYDFDSFTIFSDRLPRLEEILTEQNIEYIEPTLPAAVPEPNRPAYSSLVVELKQYLAITPPEQQQSDWNKICAEFPYDENFTVFFYGLTGLTSHASTTLEPKEVRIDPVRYIAEYKFMERAHVFSSIDGINALLNFNQFLEMARYFAAWSLKGVLTEIERMQAEELENFMSAAKDGDEPGPSGPMVKLKLELLKNYIQTNLLSPNDPAPQELAHSVTKKTDQVPQDPDLEKEIERYFSEGVPVSSGGLKALCCHFAAYGKDQFIKAMKENHVDTI